MSSSLSSSSSSSSSTTASSTEACAVCAASPAVEPVRGAACAHVVCWDCVVTRGVAPCAACGASVDPATVAPATSSSAPSPASAAKAAAGADDDAADWDSNVASESPMVGGGAAAPPRSIPVSATLVCCPRGCGETMPAASVPHHATAECVVRPVACPLLCGAAGIPAGKLHLHVEKACPNQVIACPEEGCDERHARRDAAKHAAVCPEKVVPCTHSVGGCKARVKRGELAAHVASDLPAHAVAAGEELAHHRGLIGSLSGRVSSLERRTGLGVETTAPAASSPSPTVVGVSACGGGVKTRGCCKRGVAARCTPATHPGCAAGATGPTAIPQPFAGATMARAVRQYLFQDFTTCTYIGLALLTIIFSIFPAFVPLLAIITGWRNARRAEEVGCRVASRRSRIHIAAGLIALAMRLFCPRFLFM